jgi:hypothetical protein
LFYSLGSFSVLTAMVIAAITIVSLSKFAADGADAGTRRSTD